MTKVKTKKAAKRVAGIAKALGCDAPKALLADDGGPSDALLAFCAETGATLEFVFQGNTEAMHKAVKTVRDQLHPEPNDLTGTVNRWSEIRKAVTTLDALHASGKIPDDVHEDATDPLRNEENRLWDKAGTFVAANAAELGAQFALFRAEGELCDIFDDPAHVRLLDALGAGIDRLNPPQLRG